MVRRLLGPGHLCNQLGFVIQRRCRLALCRRELANMDAGKLGNRSAGTAKGISRGTQVWIWKMQCNNELQWNWNIQKEQNQWVFRGTASAPFVPAQGLRAHGNSLSPHPRPLSTAVLARTIGKLPKHRDSASTKSRDVYSTGDFTATLLESALASNPTLTGGVSATLATCLSRHGQPAATLLRKGDSSAVCILTILLF